jgi:hypothetical protein
MERPKYNYIKNKTLLQAWEHLLNNSEKQGDCIIYKNAKDRDGYGNFKFNGVQTRTHRFSYRVNYGDIPKGMCVCHSCDNPSCMNPKHLWLGTNRENMQDRDRKERHKTADPRYTKHIGEKNGSAKLKEVDVLYIRKVTEKQKESIKELSEKFKVSTVLIRNIIKRKIWKHI